jgi:hypothetical protein
MNDPFVVEQSQVWARRLLDLDAASPEERIERMYERAFARPPEREEIEDALAFLDAQGLHRGFDTGQAQQEERVWADLCHILFNVKEFIFID